MTVLSRLFTWFMIAFSITPLLWGLITSFKQSADIITYPPKWLPVPVTFEHYEAVLTKSNLVKYLGNSMMVATLTIAVSIFIGMHGAYAASRMNFRFKNFLVFFVLATSMVPGITILVPLYTVSTKIGLHDTYTALVLVYSAWQMPTVMWILRGFIDRIPPALEEAAMVDGCSRLSAFYRVILPALRPGMAAAAMLVFIFVWNDWLIANTLTISEPLRQVQVGLFRYMGDTGVDWGRFTAYAMLGTLPIIAAFVALERFFVAGLTAGSVKG